MPKFQLHYSGLAMLSRCGEAFRRRYIVGEKIPPSASAIVGTATDRTVTQDLSSKMVNGHLLPEDHIREIARDAVNQTWDREGAMLDDEYQELGAKLARGECVDAAVSLSVMHHRHVAPSYAPIHVQREWVCDIQGSGVQLAGTIDIQEGLPGRDEIKVWDTKTSRRSPEAGEADRSMQLTTYSLAVRAHDGVLPASVGLTYLVRTKVPKVVRQTSTRTAPDLEHLLLRVSRAEQIMKSGMYMPAPLDAWWCSAKWCGYHPTCPFARRPVTVAIAPASTSA